MAFCRPSSALPNCPRSPDFCASSTPFRASLSSLTAASLPADPVVGGGAVEEGGGVFWFDGGGEVLPCWPGGLIAACPGCWVVAAPNPSWTSLSASPSVD